MTYFSRSDVVSIIYKTVDWERSRGGITVDQLIHQLWGMGALSACNEMTGIQARLVIAGLLSSGQLTMHPNGTLAIPESLPDPPIEKFKGLWFVTSPDGSIKGPFNSFTEANNVSAQFYSER